MTCFHCDRIATCECIHCGAALCTICRTLPHSEHARPRSWQINGRRVPISKPPGIYGPNVSLDVDVACALSEALYWVGKAART